MPARKIPTLDDYRKYNGAHCFHLWRSLDNTWRCPGCRRGKFEIMRWTKRDGGGVPPPGQPRGVAYEGWMAGLHRHHDHSADPPYGTGGRPRFPDTVICDQCNAAEGKVKRKLGLPKEFSFSPAEIRQFVRATPHGKHAIDLDVARRVYGQIEP